MNIQFLPGALPLGSPTRVLPLDPTRAYAAPGPRHFQRIFYNAIYIPVGEILFPSFYFRLDIKSSFKLEATKVKKEKRYWGKGRMGPLCPSSSPSFQPHYDIVTFTTPPSPPPTYSHYNILKL